MTPFRARRLPHVDPETEGENVTLVKIIVITILIILSILLFGRFFI